MGHHSTIFSQILKLVPRHEFDKLAKKHDGGRRRDAMSRWTQFVAMSTAQLSRRSSLRDIEQTIASQKHVNYHLGSGSIKRTTLSRCNQNLPSGFYEDLFGKLYLRCQNSSPRHKFQFKTKLFSLDSSLLDVSLKVFPQANYNRMKAAFKLHVGLVIKLDLLAWILFPPADPGAGDSSSSPSGRTNPSLHGHTIPSDTIEGHLLGQILTDARRLVGEAAGSSLDGPAK